MSTTPTTPEFLTVAELAERYRLSKSGVRSMVRRGTLPPPLRFGSCCRWSVEDLEKFERDQRQRYDVPTYL